MQENPAVLKNIQNLYDEVIIDEFQDINELDFSLIKMIANNSRSIITGDDDQAIYGFRGCSPEYILNLQEKLDREVETYTLKINYRSPNNIVIHSTELIRHNTWRVEKNPISAIVGNAQIKIVSALSAGIEAKLLVEYIKNVRQENKELSYDNFAILYRTNAQSLPLQVEFILNDIPYYVKEENNILEDEVLEKLLGFLRLKTAMKTGKIPKAVDAVFAVRAYFQYVNPNQIEQLKSLFDRQPNFRLAITLDEFFRILEKARGSKVNANILKALDASSLNDTLNVMATFNGMRGIVGSLEDVLDEQVPLGEISEIAANFSGNEYEFVKNMEHALKKAKELNAGKDKDGGIQLLTYFQSKGRQWHTVILNSCNEGLIPHNKAPIEDERRLFYVAMTRAECGGPMKLDTFLGILRGHLRPVE